MEALESRRILAANVSVTDLMDVNQDLRVSSLDALNVINGLDRGSSPESHDVNQDKTVTAADALTIINHLSRENSGIATPALAMAVEPPVANVVDGEGGGFETDVPAVLTTPVVVDDSFDGFLAQVFSGDLLDEGATETTVLLHSRIDPVIDFDFGSGTPDSRLPIVANDGFAVRWSGAYEPDFTGDATIYADIGDADSIRITIDGAPAIDSTDGNPVPLEFDLSVEAGVPVEIVVDFVAGPDRSSVTLGLDSLFTFRGPMASHQVTPTGDAESLSLAVPNGVLVEQFEIDAILGTSEDTSLDVLRGLPTLLANQPVTAIESPAPTVTFEAVETAGTRMRGLLSPSVSGRYVFHTFASGPAELWLSPGTDSRMARRIVSDDTPSAPMPFTDPPPSAPSSTDQVYLVAGQTYFFEALSVHESDQPVKHLSVGWTVPTEDGIESTPAIIDSTLVRPIRPTVELHANTSQTHESSDFALGTQTIVHRSDDFGRDLEVAYTIGGTAENGDDFVAASGNVIIPAGEVSATIDLLPIEDALPEDAETIVVRLAGDPRYQLGPEFSRQVTNTIAGESNNGQQILVGDPLAIPELESDNGILNVTASNVIAPISLVDVVLPFIETGEEPAGIRVDVVEAVNPWEVAVGHQFPAEEIASGSNLVASVWARNVGDPVVGDPAADGRLTIRLQEPVNYSGNERTFSVTPDWQLFVFPFTADLANETANREFELRFGDTAQSIEVAGLSLLKFDSDADFDRAPRQIASYAGRRFNSAWRDAAQAATADRFETIEISVVDASGNPVEGAIVTVTPSEPLLPIGTAVEPTLVVPALDDPSPSSDDAIRYQNLLAKYFDSLTDEYGVQRSAWEIESTRPTRLAEWVADLGLPYLGHSVVWGEIDQFPAPATLLADYEVVLNGPGGEDAAREWLKNSILDHIGMVEDDQTVGPVEALAGERADGAPLITWWDVINHPVWSREIWDIVGDDFMLNVIDATRAVVHPDTRLAINEFNILSNPENGQADDFFDLLTYLDAQSESGRADFDTIGFQSHFDSDRLPSIDAIMSQLDRFESFGRDLHITEFDVDADDIDPQTQADFTRDFFAALESKDSVTAANLWGFWQGDHWRADEDAAMVREEWSLKPNGRAWLDIELSEPQLFTQQSVPTVARVDPHSIAAVQIQEAVYHFDVPESGRIIVPEAPIANDDSFLVLQDRPLDMNLLADNGNGEDASGRGLFLAIELSMQPGHGTLEILSDDSVRYIPDPQFIGKDSFSYRVLEDGGRSATASVMVDVLDVDIALNDRLVTHFTFDMLDSASGIVPDLSPNGERNDGTLRGQARLDPSGIGEGSLRVHDGGRLLVADSRDMNTSIQDEYSVAFWFYSDELESARTQVLFEQGGTTRGLSIYLQDGRIEAGGWNRDPGQSDWSGSWLTSERLDAGWHHVALTLDAGPVLQADALRLHLDGNLVGSAEASQLWSHSDDIGIGTRVAGSRTKATVANGDMSFAGLLDEIRVYQSVLSSSVIEQLAESLPVNMTSDLVAHFTFDDVDATSTRVPDASIFGETNDATFTGNAAVITSDDGSGALELDGDGGIAVSDSRDINTAAVDKYSLAFWFYSRDSASAEPQFLYEQGGSTRGLNLYLQNGLLHAGGWNTPARESGWEGNWVTTPIADNQWHHVALVLDGTDEVLDDAMSLYLDGTLVEAVSGSMLWRHVDNIGVGQTRQASRTINGSSVNQTNGFRGWLDDLRIYRRSLHWAEVASIAAKSPSV